MRVPLIAITIVAIGLLTAFPSAQALSLTGVAAAEQSSDTGGVGIRLVDVPAASRDDPRALAYIVDRVEPGSMIERRIEVSNSTPVTRSVRVYSGGANIVDGGFVGGSDPSVNDLTSWTGFEHSVLELAAGDSAQVLVTIDVPSNASEGENYGVIWAEMTSAPEAGSTVVQAARVGIRMYLSVGTGNGAAAAFEIDGMTASRNASGIPALSAKVTNTGGRALDVSGSLSLTGGPAGLSAGPFPVEQSTTLAPGDSQEIIVSLDAELPNGPWDATLVLKSGLVEREATATITFPDAGVGETVTPDAELPVMWIAIGSGAVLLVLAAGAMLLVRRRRIRLAGRATPAEPEPSVTE